MIRSLSNFALLTFLLLQGCKVTTQVPLKAEDIRICGRIDQIVEVVKKISTQQGLSLHYGTHRTDYGTQATFRLVSDNYEIELFNSMSQSDFTLRVYSLHAGYPGNREAEQAFERFNKMLAQATSNQCK